MRRLLIAIWVVLAAIHCSAFGTESEDPSPSAPDGGTVVPDSATTTDAKEIPDSAHEPAPDGDVDAAPPTRSCPGQVIFQDDFTTEKSGWSRTNNQHSIDGGVLTVGNYAAALNQTLAFEGYRINQTAQNSFCIELDLRIDGLSYDKLGFVEVLSMDSLAVLELSVTGASFHEREGAAAGYLFPQGSAVHISIERSRQGNGFRYTLKTPAGVRQFDTDKLGSLGFLELGLTVRKGPAPAGTAQYDNLVVTAY